MDTEVEEIAINLLSKPNSQTSNSESTIQNNNTSIYHFVNKNNKMAPPSSERRFLQNGNTNLRGMNCIAPYIQPQIASDIYADTYQRSLYPINNINLQQSNFAIHQIQKSKNN